MNIQFIEIKGQGAGIKLRPDQAAGDDRFDLGRKNKFAPLAPGIIKRFFAEAVAAQNNSLLSSSHKAKANIPAS